jgi:DNA replication protein DnaC
LSARRPARPPSPPGGCCGAGNYGRVDLLLIDELGHLQLDRRGAELLFQVLTEREERSAIAIASNEPFSAWTKTFTDPRLSAVI